MTDDALDPPTSAVEPEQARLVEEVAQELATGDPARVERAARALDALRRALVVLAVPVVSTGVLAVALSLWAWHGSPVVLAIFVLLALPALVLPVNLVRRTQALVDVAAHPRQAMDQARDLIEHARSLPELEGLATAARAQFRDERGRRPGARQVIRLLRLVGATVEAGQPDPDRHPLLMGLRPEQLGKVWRGGLLSLWAWAVAGLVAVIGLIGGLAGAA